MLDAIQDRFREGTVIAAQLIVPAIAIILRAKDGGRLLASPMEEFQYIVLF